MVLLYAVALPDCWCRRPSFLQQHLFEGIGREMTPTFLGGDLDFDSTARHWWDKMDAAIAERTAHPKGQQVGRAAWVFSWRSMLQQLYACSSSAVCACCVLHKLLKSTTAASAGC